MNLEKLKSFVSSDLYRAKDPLVSRINKHLVKEYNPPASTSSRPSHSPSSIGTKCYRKIYYQFFKLDKDIPVDARGAKIFESGKQHEEMVMTWLKALGEHIPYTDPESGLVPMDRDGVTPNPQFPIKSPEWRINKGFIDNVGIIDGKLWLYEIKSSNSNKFQSLEAVMPEHKDQVSIYLKTFNELLKAGEFSHIPELKPFEEVVGVKVLYINKDNSDIKVFSLRKNHLQANIWKLKSKIERANKYIDEKQLPPKTPDKCEYCPFKTKCSKSFNVV